MFHVIDTCVAFEGLSLGDLKPHESILERRRNAALAQNEPRKSPQRPVEACEPLVLKPHICKIAQRKEDASLVERYKTAREQNIPVRSPQSASTAASTAESPSAVQWEQHKHEESQNHHTFTAEEDIVSKEATLAVEEEDGEVGGDVQEVEVEAKQNKEEEEQKEE